MSSASRAWLVATSIGAVEALKDQGFCRWNYAMRLLHHHAKANLRSYAQANKLSSSSIFTKREHQKLKESEESLRKVMYLSCWGPNQLVQYACHDCCIYYSFYNHTQILNLFSSSTPCLHISLLSRQPLHPAVDPDISFRPYFRKYITRK